MTKCGRMTILSKRVALMLGPWQCGQLPTCYKPMVAPGFPPRLCVRLGLLFAFPAHKFCFVSRFFLYSELLLWHFQSVLDARGETRDDDDDDDDDNNNNGGIAAHCCGIFSCTNPLDWPVGVVGVAELYF